MTSLAATKPDQSVEQTLHWQKALDEMSQAREELLFHQAKFHTIDPSKLPAAVNAIRSRLEQIDHHLGRSQLSTQQVLRDRASLWTSLALLKMRLPSPLPSPKPQLPNATEPATNAKAQGPAKESTAVLPSAPEPVKKASPPAPGLGLLPPPEEKESQAKSDIAFTRIVPVGIIRKNTLNCWVNAGLQFIRAIPSLYRLTVEEIKDFRDFFKLYEKYGERNKPVPEKNSQQMRDYFSARFGDPLAADEGMADAHEGLMAIMKRYRGPKIRIVKNKDQTERETTCSIIPISLATHQKMSLEELFEREFTPKEQGEKHYFHEAPNELFFQLVRNRTVRGWRGNYLGNKKITDDVACGMTFKLSSDRVLTKTGATYACDAFIVHNSSHYVAYIRVNSKWYLVDDEDVQPVSDKLAQKALKQAYIIHYAKN